MDDDMTNLIEAGKLALESHVREGDPEFMPVLLVEAGDGVLTVVVLAGGHPFDVLAAALPMLHDLRPVKMSLTVDSYVIIGDLDDEVDIMAVKARYGGSLARAFEAGEPSVTEALNFTVVTPEEAIVVIQPYVRRNMGDLRPIEWGEPTTKDGIAAGRMVDVLRAVFA